MNNADNVEIDFNDILNSMSDQIAKQARDIAVLTATITAMQKKQESDIEPSSAEPTV